MEVFFILIAVALVGWFIWDWWKRRQFEEELLQKKIRMTIEHVARKSEKAARKKMGKGK